MDTSVLFLCLVLLSSIHQSAQFQKKIGARTKYIWPRPLTLQRSLGQSGSHRYAGEAQMYCEWCLQMNYYFCIRQYCNMAFGYAPAKRPDVYNGYVPAIPYKGYHGYVSQNLIYGAHGFARAYPHHRSSGYGPVKSHSAYLNGYARASPYYRFHRRFLPYDKGQLASKVPIYRSWYGPKTIR